MHRLDRSKNGHSAVFLYCDWRRVDTFIHQVNESHCRSILRSNIINAKCKSKAIEPPFVERNDLKESLKKDGLDMKMVDTLHYLSVAHMEQEKVQLCQKY